MLEVVFFESNQDLLVKMRGETAPLVVCPSPQVADNLRTLVPELNVITISKWTSDHLKTLNLTRLRKSELMIKLSSVWKHYFPTGKTQTFLEAFELFTELRSFTLSLDLLAEFFKELDEDIVKSILLFWTFLDQEKIIDEHLSYKKVTEAKKHCSFSLVGFKHLSGVQIDMLQVLSESVEVKVFFPLGVFEETLPNDWIRWLSDLSPEKALSSGNLKSLNIVSIPKGKANLILNKFFKQHENYDLILASTKVSLISLQEVQKDKAFFKTAEDLFAIEIENLFLNLRNEKISDANLLLGSLDQKRLISAKAGEYRKYKIIELTMAALKEFANFQVVIDEFALDIFQVIVRLNSPRVSLLTLEEKIQHSFIDINELNFRDDKKPNVILATGGMGGFKAAEKILSENMSKALKSIGPIKRAGLDFLFHKYELNSVLERKETVLLIEELLLETDLSWREVLKNFELVEYDLGIKYEIKKIKEYLKPRMKSGPFEQKYYSASRIQAFLDCPQKFYFNYIDKIDNRPEERSTLSADELGNLEHSIIAQYFAQKGLAGEMDTPFHQKLCQQVFNSYLEKGKLHLSETERARSLNELMHYTWNGVTFLIDLVKDGKAREMNFEVPLASNPWSLVGSIDCLIELQDGKVVVVDFKRSGNAVGTKSETLEFRKIQLWVYLLTLIHQKMDISSFGYLNLSDLGDDTVFFDENETTKILSQSIEAARKVVESAIDKIKTTVEFLPQPRDSKVCHFCPVNLFCLKGGA